MSNRSSNNSRKTRNSRGGAQPSRGKHAAPQKKPARQSRKKRKAAQNSNVSPNRNNSQNRSSVPGQSATLRQNTSTYIPSSKTNNASTRSAAANRGARQKKKRRVPKPVKIILAVVIAVCVAGGSFLAWNTFFRYNDAADIQGEWKIEGTNTSIVITNSEIRLTDSVSFSYELNTFEKTITYTYSNYSGVGTYEFSEERDVLTLTDVVQDEHQTNSQETISLLKVQDQALGEPETATNNTTEQANTFGADVVAGNVAENTEE